MILALLLAAAEPPRFDPIRFFAGRTEGAGRLKVVLRRGASVRVHGRGRPGPDGALVLDQLIEEEGKPARSRRWQIRRVAPGRYAGALTDARGPVSVEGIGDRLRIRYTAAGGGVAIEQWLTLAADGRSARNRLVARKFGITVARLDEVIRKAD